MLKENNCIAVKNSIILFHVKSSFPNIRLNSILLCLKFGAECGNLQAKCLLLLAPFEGKEARFISVKPLSHLGFYYVHSRILDWQISLRTRQGLKKKWGKTWDLSSFLVFYKIDPNYATICSCSCRCLIACIPFICCKFTPGCTKIYRIQPWFQLIIPRF